MNMKKYTDNIKKYFALITQRLDTYAKNPMNAKSKDSILAAKQAISTIEQKILKNPFGIVWVDIFNNWDVIKVLDARAIAHLKQLFIWAYEKQPVENIRSANDVDTMTRTAIYLFINQRISPNTLTLQPVQTVGPIVLRTQSPIIFVQQQTLKVANTKKH